MPFEFHAGVTRAQALLRLDGVGLSFGDRVVLRDVRAEVREVVRPGHSQGQVVALLGPSGVGKTQLFRVMAGLQEPTAGRALVGPALEPVRAGMVGVVDQRATLFRHRTVGDNLLLAARGRGAEARARAEALLARFGLADRWGAWPCELSGGQRQRVAIAQQLLSAGHYLLMDEPFSGLDPVMQAEACRLIAEVAAMDTLNTVVVVTHDVAAAAAIADTVWLLGRDRDADGTPVPGARVQAEYDLVARGLAWRPDVDREPAFHELVREVRQRFRAL